MKKILDLKKRSSITYTPTSAWAIFHHTDQNGPNILKGSVGKTKEVRKQP